jgi:CHAT domain-containing protein
MNKFIFIICTVCIINLIFGSVSFSQSWQLNDSISQMYIDNQNYDSAFVYAEKVLNAVKEKTGENDTLYTNVLASIVEILYYQGKYEKAIEYCEKEKEITKKLHGNKSLFYASSLNNLAVLYWQMGNYYAAEPLYIEAKNIDKEILGEKNASYAIDLNNLANLYQSMGNYSAAEPLYLEAKNIRKEVLGEKHPDYANILNDLAELYKYIGNYPTSEQYYLEAKSIWKEVLGEKHPLYATSIDNLAALYFAMGNYTAAEPLYKEAMNIRKEVLGEKHPDYALSLNNLANSYTAMHNFSLAESLYVESKNINREVYSEKHPSYAVSLNNLAWLYETMGDFATSKKEIYEKYSKAESLYLEALKIRKEALGDKHPFYAKMLNNIAVLYCKMQNYSEAEIYYQEVLKIITSNIFQNFSFLSEKEKEMYFKNKVGTFSDFYSFSLKRKTENPEITKEVFNNIIMSKGLLLKSSTAMRTAILNSNDTLLISQYKKWIALKKEISELYSTEIDKRENNPEELEQQSNAIEKDLVRSSQIFNDFEKVQKLTWESVRNSLKPDEVAIEFIRFSEDKKSDTTTYCALLISPRSKQPEMIRLFEEKEMKTVLGKSGQNNYSFINNIYGTNINTNEALYKLIWQPLEPYLTGVKTIFYSPDGILHKVSFAAIGKSKNVYLCDNYNLQLVSSTGKVAMSENTFIDKNLTACVIGGIDYATDSSGNSIWQYLPGTLTEASAIKTKLLKNNIMTNTYVGKEATELNFKNIFSVEGNCPELLHIATHGFFYPDPEQVEKEEKANENEKTEIGKVIFRGGNLDFGLWQFVKNKNPLMRSGLVLAGANKVWSEPYSGTDNEGVLTAQEVSQLNMSKTRLVVLSACETGLGDIKGSEGVYGLQRAFKMAGVKFIIMSLWQVPDKETGEFMETFYSKLLKQKNIGLAFTETQTEMRKKYDPYFWAAFVLIE